MYRFRKKSDIKTRPVLPDQTLRQPLPEPPTELLPELPPESDFRTSLILPDLSRRFTLLRNSSGEPVSLDVLRLKLEEQRSRGVENQVSEEEESMILESLGFRSKSSSTLTDSNGGDSRESPSSSSTSTPRSTKRYSNNLFGSKKLRDDLYMRSVKHTSSRVQSSASSSSNLQISNTTPDRTYPSTLEFSTFSDDQTDARHIRPPQSSPPDSYHENPVYGSEYRASKTMSPLALKRASLAVEDALREIIEEEAEDEIVMPRSAPLLRSSLEQQQQQQQDSLVKVPLSASKYEPGTAISVDQHNQVEPELASPTPLRVPGYVPGMPRPMTPRDNVLDSEDIRSHTESTTPRAMSPSNSNDTTSASGNWRRESASAALKPSIKIGSPSPNVFLPGSSSGRFTPENTRKGDSSLTDFEFPISSMLQKRRPASPLSGPSYQPLIVGASSRPGTPSNVTWKPPMENAGSAKSSFDHVRNGSSSWFSDESGGLESLDHSKRSLKSPPLPDSPVLARGHSISNSFSSPPPESWTTSLPDFDLGSPMLSSRPIRSPTPTQSVARSPTSTVFPVADASPQRSSKRSSGRNIPSPFRLDLTNRVIFSPIANSSRSSLESEGSSYHSWEEDDKGRNLNTFLEPDGYTPWHDVPNGRPSDSSSAASPNDEFEAEDVIHRYAGLKRADFVAIQQKLFGVAMSKHSIQVEPLTRSPSLRRRRPSTSQSNYSLNGRIISPLQFTTPLSPPSSVISTTTADLTSSSSHSALLHAMVDSIEPSSPSSPQDTVTPRPASPGDVSPDTSRRNRDLAQVLFGDDRNSIDAVEKSSGNTVSVSPSLIEISSASSTILPPITPITPLTPSFSEISKSPYSISMPSNSSLSRQHTKEEEAVLTREVQRKADAAMQALKKPSLQTHFSPGGSTSRRRVSPHQISTPTLVSASTSVDTIPLRSPMSGTTTTPSKIGSRFKKLRGTLRRTNQVPNGDEVTPFRLEVQSTSTTTVHSPGPNSAPLISGTSNISDVHDFKYNVTSPPASAGPGLKGFMARFRSKTRSDLHFDDQQGTTHDSSMPYLPQRHPHPQNLSSSKLFPVGSPPPQPPTSPSADSSTGTDESVALRQLFDAANNLGLDQGKLNDLLLVRSGSTASRATDWTALSRNNSTAAPSRRSQSMKAFKTKDTTSFKPNRSSIDENPTASGSNITLMKPSIRKSPPESTLRPREDIVSTVVRRTLYLPSDSGSPSAVDLNALIQKNSKRNKRASAASGRSIHDRAPTPPPFRSPHQSSQFPNEFPPVPQLPSFVTQSDNRLTVPAPGPIEKSGSAYESLYEMYTTEDGKPADSHSALRPPRNTIFQGQGTALEVIELANGEVIWNIVNGLRDEDTDSLYAGRASFSSDYSTRDSQDNGMKVFFKEHARGGSKGSSTSMSLKKSPVTGARPNTQIYVTPSKQIADLVQNLSQGLDAGTFNFSVNDGVLGHSATSSMSENEWTVEERLEQMLGAMRSS